MTSEGHQKHWHCDYSNFLNPKGDLLIVSENSFSIQGGRKKYQTTPLTVMSCPIEKIIKIFNGLLFDDGIQLDTDSSFKTGIRQILGGIDFKVRIQTHP
jgi:hypothetical protein